MSPSDGWYTGIITPAGPEVQTPDGDTLADVSGWRPQAGHRFGWGHCEQSAYNFAVSILWHYLAQEFRRDEGNGAALKAALETARAHTRGFVWRIVQFLPREWEMQRDVIQDYLVQLVCERGGAARDWPTWRRALIQRGFIRAGGGGAN